MVKKFTAVILAMLCIMTALTACGNSKTQTDESTAGTVAPETTHQGIFNFHNDYETTQPPVTEAPTTQKPSIPDGAKLIALTYDDGPYTKTTSRILDTLEKNNSVATFFIVGNRIGDNVSTLKRAIDMGCEIGNHTYDHKNLVKASEDVRSSQISDTNSKMKEQFGYDVTLLRAPEGAIKGIKDKVGMPLIQWSIDTEDWKHKDAANPGRSEADRQAKINSIADDVVENAKPGDIVLMHDIYEFTADLSEVLIPKLIAKGYILVTVSELYEYYGLDLSSGQAYIRAEVTEPEVTYAPGKYTVKIDSDPTLNLRDNPGMGNTVIAEIPNGTQVEVTEISGNWAKVTYGELTGWLITEYLIQSAS